MSDAQFFQVASRTREAKIVTGSFGPNGAGAISAATVKGDGFTVARTGKGTFLLTLRDKYPTLVSALANLRLAAAHGYKVNVGAADVSGAGTVALHVESIEPVRWVKADADGQASDATSETLIGMAVGAMPIGHTLYLTPQAALTAHNTNYATITVSKRTAGATKTTVATFTTQITGTGSWVAFTTLAIPLSVAVAPGDTLQVEIAKAASGVVVPALVLQAAGLQDVASNAANAIEFSLLLKNSTVT